MIKLFMLTNKRNFGKTYTMRKENMLKKTPQPRNRWDSWMLLFKIRDQGIQYDHMLRSPTFKMDGSSGQFASGQFANGQGANG